MQKKHSEKVSYKEWLEAFQERRRLRLQPAPTFVAGEHPKHTGIGKKDTSFYPGCCNVLFDRKTIPKSGKSIVDGCFVKDKNGYHLIYDVKTRALLGLDINKIKQYKELLDDRIKRTTSNG